jgi:alpha/beta superfamily hydrolase
MRKIVTAFLLCMCLTSGLSAQASGSGPAGYWDGTFSESGADLHVSISFGHNSRGAWSGRFTSPSQGVMDYPFDSVTVQGDSVAFVLGGGDIVASGKIQGDQIDGTFTGDQGKGTWLFHRTERPHFPYTTQSVIFHNGAVRLAGSVCTPSGGARHPAVVLLHGSGPESRWGTMRFIADQLARRGVATLIYDKRGSGDSGGDWRTASYEDLADDAIAALRLLQTDKNIDTRSIGIWGHSQGGYLAPLIASRTKGVAFIVAADSPAMPQYEQDIFRVRNLVRQRMDRQNRSGRDGAVHTIHRGGQNGSALF